MSHHNAAHQVRTIARRLSLPVKATPLGSPHAQGYATLDGARYYLAVSMDRVVAYPGLPWKDGRTVLTPSEIGRLRPA